MVVMPVRDQHRVDRPFESGRRCGAAQVGHPLAQERIGEDPHTVELEEHGGVPEPANVQQRYWPEPRPRSRAKRSRA
jgi:hypothetical protein